MDKRRNGNVSRVVKVGQAEPQGPSSAEFTRVINQLKAQRNYAMDMLAEYTAQLDGALGKIQELEKQIIMRDGTGVGPKKPFNGGGPSVETAPPPNGDGVVTSGKSA